MFWYATAFALFYFEPVAIGPFNVASIWKVVAIGICFTMIVLVPRYQRIPAVALLGFLFSLVSIINPSLMTDSAETIGYALKYLYIPLMFVMLYGFHRKFKFNSKVLLSFSTHVSTFIALSGVPFVAGVLEPIASGGYDLSLFGLEGRGFNGIFFNAHGASIAMATAAIHLTWAAKNSKAAYSVMLFVALATFALYCVYSTFARTGYAMAACGIAIVVYMPFRFWKLIFLTPLIIIGGFIAASVVLDDEVLVMRIVGENIHTIESGAGADLSSGRARFWAAAVDAYKENPSEWLFGAGPDLGKERMQQRVNLRISSHNDVFNALLFSGGVGLLIYLAYTFALMQTAWSVRRAHRAGDLVWALTVAYLLQLLLQGERVLLSELLLVLAIFSAKIETNNNQRKKVIRPLLISNRLASKGVLNRGIVDAS